MEKISLTKCVDVEAALLDERLVPPPAPASLSPGTTTDLRNSMARFSTGTLHTNRRAEVQRTVMTISHWPFARKANAAASAILSASRDERSVDIMAEVGFVVPVDAIAAALGIERDDLPAVRSEVASIVEVIGRNGPSGTGSDTAATRLVERTKQLGHDPVAAVTLLYQSYDACAAMFASALLADQTGGSRRSSITSTVRIVNEDTEIGGLRLRPGGAVVPDLETSGFEFGLGSHGCPGRAIAERIIAGMLAAVREDDRELNVEEIEWRADRRPQTLPLEVVSSHQDGSQP